MGAAIAATGAIIPRSSRLQPRNVLVPKPGAAGPFMEPVDRSQDPADRELAAALATPTPPAVPPVAKMANEDALRDNNTSVPRE